MKDQDVKKEFKKVILYAKLSAAVFFILLAPSIVVTIKDLPELYGIDKDTWLNVSIVGFAIYGVFYFFLWKCPKCKEYPGRGWFRKNCEKCGAELN